MDHGQATANGFLTVTEVRWRLIRQRKSLTPRQLEVLRAVWTGGKFSTLAAQLGMSQHAFDKHWRDVKTRLGIPAQSGHEGRTLAIHAIYRFATETWARTNQVEPTSNGPLE